MMPEREILTILLHAIRKQIPMRPFYKEAVETGLFQGYACPACGHTFTNVGMAEYCYHCGQHLEWPSLKKVAEDLYEEMNDA
jgi:uncharacterized OB-fold protein